jgi:hypothetical protein
MMLNKETKAAPKPTLVSALEESCFGSTRRGLHKQMICAGFNRRMRKTACPVVWKACGA